MNSSSARLVDAGDFPKVILLDTINACNLRCSMCGRRNMTRKVGIMSQRLFKRLIDEIAERDKQVRVWMVFFGEALILKQHIYSMIGYAKEKGLTDVVLNSNGALMDADSSFHLIKSKLDAIYIGLDATCKETYSKLRVGGDYDRVVANVNELLMMKRRLRAATPQVFVQFVVMPENESEIDNFTRYWSERGATVKIRPKVTWAGTVPSYGNRDVERYPCYWAMRTLNICCDGKIALCSCDYDAKLDLGSVANNTIQDVWLGELKALRDLHLQGQFDGLPEMCRNCTDWQMARAEYRR